MKIGIGIGELAGRPLVLDELIAQAQQAEQDGFASAWLASAFGIDPLIAVAAIARATSRIELGTAVVPTFLRHPVAMAQEALTLQAVTRGRFALGIGLSHPMVIESMLGLSYAKPFTHMKEYLVVLTALIRNGSVSYQGREFQVHANVTAPGTAPCPILLAALAPKMLALAGAESDGTITWMTGPKTLRDYIVPRINEAAAAAGRPAPRVIAGLRVAVTEEVAAAREWARSALQFYGHLPSYRAMLDREGVEGPADITIVGDEATVSDQLHQLAASGVTELLAIPFSVGGDRQASLERTRTLLRKLTEGGL
ncbi:MAG: family F420-dependent class oxidoreductase [Deltaproteobacteria bacterium]|nr:family F420-dependent class oxidoreductase [Deltaproteobacteria bacterium]